MIIIKNWPIYFFVLIYFIRTLTITGDIGMKTYCFLFFLLCCGWLYADDFSFFNQFYRFLTILACFWPILACFWPFPGLFGPKKPISGGRDPTLSPRKWSFQRQFPDWGANLGGIRDRKKTGYGMSRLDLVPLESEIFDFWMGHWFPQISATLSVGNDFAKLSWQRWWVFLSL